MAQDADMFDDEGGGGDDANARLRKQLMGMGSPGAPGSNPYAAPTGPGSVPSVTNGPGSWYSTGSSTGSGFGTSNPIDFDPNTTSIQRGDAQQETGDNASRDYLVNQNEGILGFDSGNPQNSPLYHSLLSNSKDAISNSYDQAVANTRSSSAARGFGYTSPVEEGGEAGVRSVEAGDLSAAPSAALQTTNTDELQAAGITAGEASMYGGEGTAAEGMENSLAQARMQKSVGMTDAMVKLLQAEMASAAAGAGA